MGFSTVWEFFCELIGTAKAAEDGGGWTNLLEEYTKTELGNARGTLGLFLQSCLVHWHKTISQMNKWELIWQRDICVMYIGNPILAYGELDPGNAAKIILKMCFTL